MTVEQQQARRIPLICSECGLPYAYLLPDGCIIVGSRHHGEIHHNVLTVEKVEKLRQEVRPNER